MHKFVIEQYPIFPMKVYRFHITMPDNPDVIRVIDISGDQTFEVLHFAILDSVGFDSSQLASFYVCNNDWERKYEITLIDMGGDEEAEALTPVMKEAKIKDFLSKKGLKLIYEYDFVLMWTFNLVLEDIREPESEKTGYPILVHSEGEAPSQYETKEKYPEEVTDEDTKYIRNLELKNFNHFSNEEGDDDEIWEDEYGTDKDDFYGFNEEEEY